ncbi:SigE family RNA polymerase sigma factor [Catellatospora vulcania]|uniref:SigE family RNA polymerase sigma factor n=1 Tax=Catellatospora vulcania TaxID=1460450 RepID=UPI0012D46316|nr:SigE family RNA polymerase sigma factor [Catellatospora vulcania]
MDRYDGFHEFVVARGGALSRTAFLLTGEHHAAEDLVQSALAKAAVRWRWLVEHTQPEAYIRRIMINEQISWWRKRPARPVAQVPERAGPDEPGRAVERIALGRALDTLTPRQRAVIVLRFYEDLSEADTAALMGCSVGTVKSQTHLALGHLRRALPLFADRAGEYADADAALALARRRRTGRAVTAVLVAVPMLVGLLWFASRGPDTVPPPVTSTPSGIPAPVKPLPALPSRLDPNTRSEPLPDDRGPGPAVLQVHDDQTSAGPRASLVMVDGRHYSVPAPESGFVSAPSLSPDGRWLTWSTRTATTVRDLTGTQIRELPATLTAPLWSPGGDWFLLPARAGTGETLYHLPDWTARDLPAVPWDRATKVVLDSGELLRSAGSPTTTSVPLEVVDPSTGAVRAITVDATGRIETGESMRSWSILAAPGDTAGVEVLGAGGSAEVTDVLQFSTVDGLVLRRISLPKRHLGFPLCFRGTDLLWTDLATIRRAPAPKDLELLMQLDDPMHVVEPAGCRRSTQLSSLGS